MIDVDSSSPKNSGALTPLWFCGSSVGSAQCTSLNHFHTLRLSSTPTVAPWDSQTCCNTLHRQNRGLPGTAEGVVGLVLGVAAATTSSGDKGPGQPRAAVALHTGAIQLLARRKGSGGRWAPNPKTLVRVCGRPTAAADRHGFHVAPASAVWEHAKSSTEEQAQQTASQRDGDRKHG